MLILIMRVFGLFQNSYVLLRASIRKTLVIVVLCMVSLGVLSLSNLKLRVPFGSG